MIKFILLAAALLLNFVQSQPIEQQGFGSVGPRTPPVVPRVQSAVQPARPKLVTEPTGFYQGHPGVVNSDPSSRPGVGHGAHEFNNGAREPTGRAQKLRFRISLRDLEDVDLIGKTDPYVKLYYTEGSKTLETFIGQTKVKENNENPDFAKVFDFDYKPGTRQKFHFVVHDDDSSAKDDKVGEAFLELDEYVRNMGNIEVNLRFKGRLILKRV